jgi:NAD(P)-dependent dehydrogenase (short-subunit alcohol dehydrogenase family)
MSLVFISGSSDGLGLLAARLLVDWGHEVTLHARSAARAEDAPALITPPERLVYLSSGMHMGGEPRLHDPQWTARRWNGAQAYSDSKLLDVVLAFAVARRWPSVLSNALEPGWVPTKMGGPGAPDDLSLAAVTQTWLAVSDDPAARVTGQYFYHQQRRRVHSAALQKDLQDELLDYCAGLTSVPFPRESRKGD